MGGCWRGGQGTWGCVSYGRGNVCLPVTTFCALWCYYVRPAESLQNRADLVHPSTLQPLRLIVDVSWGGGGVAMLHVDRFADS
jgi:hypothetical protein